MEMFRSQQKISGRSQQQAVKMSFKELIGFARYCSYEFVLNCKRWVVSRFLFCGHTIRFLAVTSKNNP